MSTYGLCLLCFMLYALKRVPNSVTDMLGIYRNERGLVRDGKPVNLSLPECGALEVVAAQPATEHRVP
jgi:hypothetical protein